MSHSNAAKWVRRISYSLAALLLLVLIIDFVLNLIFEQKLRTQLEKISETEIRFESAHANLFTLSFILKNVDVTYFGKIGKDHSHKFNIEELSVAGVNIIKWWSSNTLSVRRILLKNGTLVLDKYLLDTKDTSDTKKAETNIYAHNVDFRNVAIKVEEDKKTQLECSGETHLMNFSSLAPQDLQKLAFRLHHVVYNMSGTHGQVLHVEDVLVNSDKSEAILDSIHIATPVDKKEYARTLGFQTDYFDAHTTKITMTGFDVLSLLKNKIAAHKITIEAPGLYVYRDRRVPDRKKVKKMPGEVLDDLKTNLLIDTLSISDADVVYEERPSTDPDTTGIISFSRTNSVTYHLYNHPAKGEQETMTVISHSQLRGNGVIDVKFVFPIVKGQSYHVKGEFKHLDLTSLNNSCINLGHMKIKSGRLNSLAFDFSFDHKQSRGKIVGDYNDLVAEKLKVKEGKLQKDKFKSTVEQTIVIPKNKDRTMPEKQRTGKINYTREPNKFVWNYMLNSLLDGIRSSFNLGFMLPGDKKKSTGKKLKNLFTKEK
jgi:hypothetical protein